MNQELAGRIAIVAGGGSGIGKAICLARAEEGAPVTVDLHVKPCTRQRILVSLAQGYTNAPWASSRSF